MKRTLTLLLPYKKQFVCFFASFALFCNIFTSKEINFRTFGSKVCMKFTLPHFATPRKFSTLSLYWMLLLNMVLKPYVRGSSPYRAKYFYDFES